MHDLLTVLCVQGSRLSQQGPPLIDSQGIAMGIPVGKHPWHPLHCKVNSPTRNACLQHLHPHADLQAGHPWAMSWSKGIGEGVKSRPDLQSGPWDRRGIQACSLTPTASCRSRMRHRLRRLELCLHLPQVKPCAILHKPASPNPGFIPTRRHLVRLATPLLGRPQDDAF